MVRLSSGGDKKVWQILPIRDARATLNVPKPSIRSAGNAANAAADPEPQVCY